MKRRIFAFTLILALVLAFAATALAAEGDENTPTPPTSTASPSPTEAPVIVDRLRIDSTTLYPGMEKTYAQGYVPNVQNGRALIVLPLLGATYDGKVTLTADLGTTTDSPFVFGNYTQTVWGNYNQASFNWGGTGTVYGYLFAMEIPLAKARYNGAYPVTLKAEYLDVKGTRAEQSFIVYVTVTDGKTPPDPNEVEKTPAEKPELFISSCTVEPQVVGGNGEFSVAVTVENIGNLRARSVKLTYGSEAAGIVPADINNAILLENIAAEESAAATFSFKTDKDVLAGSQSFFITLDYADLYGGAYTATREFLIRVTQPVQLSYDKFTVPKSVVAGDTFSLPANVFNTGKATLRNVTVTAAGAGLFPVSSVFLGDIAPGEMGSGELKIFAGMLSMTEGYTQDYGATHGVYTITYYDDADELYTVSVEFSTEIKQPVIQADTDEDKEKEKPVVQWWVAVLVGFAVIAILVTGIVITKVTRTMRLK
ncbi:MAG TPA: hypothetical protein VN512_13410 [Clostridia bacterium]|nr:hypothetical protein [Clostridia bacterium]